MEEVDSIILHFFRQLNVSINEDIKNICDLPVETIVESASKCLTSINQSIKVPQKLPSGISHRIEVANQIASACKDLGYKNDVGYQTFLYYNEVELRQVFMFLIEKLPNDSKQPSVSNIQPNKYSLLKQSIGSKIAEELNSIWIPPCCTQSRLGPEENYEYISERKTNTTINQLTENELIEKLLKIERITDKALNINISEGVKEKDSPPEERIKITSDKSLKELKELIVVLKQKLDALQSEKNVMDVEYTQATKLCERIEADLKNMQNVINSVGITNIDSEDISENLLEKIKRDINLLHRKSEELTSKNLSLKVQIDKVKTSIASSESERSRCKKTLTQLKNTAKTLKEECERKEEIKKQLQKNYEKLKSGNKRSIYTKRILEIISNVDKQNMEIKKIIDDTRLLQKEINTLEGQLDRCFSAADETLFKDAKKDDQAKKAYKLLALLHSECNTIVSLVNDTGSLAREIVDLEDNIKTEKAKRTEDTLKKIQNDLTKMYEESSKN